MFTGAALVIMQPGVDCRLEVTMCSPHAEAFASVNREFKTVFTEKRVIYKA